MALKIPNVIVDVWQRYVFVYSVPISHGMPISMPIFENGLFPS